MPFDHSKSSRKLPEGQYGEYEEEHDEPLLIEVIHLRQLIEDVKFREKTHHVDKQEVGSNAEEGTQEDEDVDAVGVEENLEGGNEHDSHVAHIAVHADIACHTIISQRAVEETVGYDKYEKAVDHGLKEGGKVLAPSHLVLLLARPVESRCLEKICLCVLLVVHGIDHDREAGEGQVVDLKQIDVVNCLA